MAPTDGSPRPKPPRADARRNRKRVLAAARDAFAADGATVSLDEIARRAGVGAGTVHRHFPTKDELFQAVIADRLQELTAHARDLATADAAGLVFFGFLHRLADDAADNLALSAALSTPAVPAGAVLHSGAELEAALGTLLARAQQAGAVRPELDTRDLHAILAGALAMEQRLSPGSRGRGLDVVLSGLRPDR